MPSSGTSQWHAAPRVGEVGSDELERFERMLDRCERVGAGHLPFEELRDLAFTNRRVAAALARLRGRARDPEAIHYLNALCVRAHALLAVPHPSQHSHLLPRLRSALGRTWTAQCTAWALLSLGLLLGAALVTKDTRAAYALLPESLGYTTDRIDRLLQSGEAREAFLAPNATPIEVNLLFGSQLFANNTRVGMLAMAAGILAGVPTVLLTVYNGAVLGAFSAAFWRPPHRAEFLAWLLPHGIPEFTAIALCAAAGLLLGAAMVGGDRRGRRAGWREAAESALVLFATALPLLVAAALIESFVRESLLGTGVRLAIAAAMAVLVPGLLWGASRAGRGPRRIARLDEPAVTPRAASPGTGSAPLR